MYHLAIRSLTSSRRLILLDLIIYRAPSLPTVPNSNLWTRPLSSKARRPTDRPSEERKAEGVSVSKKHQKKKKNKVR